MIPLYRKVILKYIINFFLSIITFMSGLTLSEIIPKIVIKILKIRKIDETVINFLNTLIKYGVVIFTIIVTLNVIGVQTSSILTVIGAAGIAIGLALQGSLSNLAAGMLLVSFRHFRVNDFVDLSGITGTVISVQLFSTTLKTLDGRIVIVPNSRILSGNIVNFSTEPNKLIDVSISVNRNSNIDFVKKCIKEKLCEEEQIVHSVPIIVQVSSITSSSIDFSIRAWVKRENIRLAISNILEKLDCEFKEKKISPPCIKTKIILIKED
ncbi:mechanosensitive channel (plasmid) [endosymbiont of Sipalinus gigas]|uniref:mechanosensitive ion channel domain-containing protein n=1 Tax=endosymbiont of Sipalinus gigas TaxID=1972134 RepID=UPI000DC70B7B|nr:mechanosensitive ion channel domain-containing protein [endosymbiont of Sipalinus gigas]BBA85387.1 mechanosensitive channel [endosymbiont of Sipalinus gigas]